MAGTLVVFDVDDTSPTVNYYPAVHNSIVLPGGSPPVGWTPYYTESGYACSLGQEGRGISQHRTSLQGATLTLQFTGTGITILGESYANASFSVTLDGASINFKHPPLPNNTLLSISDLHDTLHTISLTSTISDSRSMITFDKAVIASQPHSTGSVSEQTLNDTLIQYEGNWVTKDEFRLSSAQGDVVRTSFTGTSLLIRGLSKPSTGAYSVTLDGTTSNYTSTSVFSQSDVLLFYASGLNASQVHDLAITNIDGSELILYKDGFSTNSSGETWPSSSPTPSAALNSPHHIPAGTIAALVLAGLLLIVINGALVYCFGCRSRRRRARALLDTNRGHNTNEVLHTRSPSVNVFSRRGSNQSGSARSGFARWKAEMENSISGLGNGLGITFRRSSIPTRAEGDVWSDEEGLEKEDAEGELSFHRWSADGLPTLSSNSTWNAKGDSRNQGFPDEFSKASSRDSSLSEFIAAPAVNEGRRVPQAPREIAQPIFRLPRQPVKELVLDSAAVHAALRDLSPRVSVSLEPRPIDITNHPAMSDSSHLGQKAKAKQEPTDTPNTQQRMTEVSCPSIASSYQNPSISRLNLNGEGTASGKQPDLAKPPRGSPSHRAHNNTDAHRRNMSFLDLEASDASTASRQSSRHVSVNAQHEASHWSLTTQHSTEPDNSSSSSSFAAAAAFPFPISLPPSSHHPEGSRPSQASVLGRLNTFPDTRAELPSSYIPLSNVPSSVALDSRNGANQTHDDTSETLPPHPALPKRFFNARYQYSPPRTKHS